MNKIVNKALVNGHPHKLPRKQRISWMEARLRRLRSVKAGDRSERQALRIRQLESAILAQLAFKK